MMSLMSLMVLMASVGSYLLGSVCSAVIVCHLCHLPDPRTQGSRNPGTTNVLRLSGKKYAVIVLLADMLKGFLPVFILQRLHWMPDYIGYIGLAAVLGHMYPIFFHFKGGKGVATTLGVLLGLDVRLGLAALVTWVIVALLTRYSSLAAMVAILLAPVYVLLMMKSSSVFLPMMIIAGCVLYQHRDNMKRLWQGKESKIKL